MEQLKDRFSNIRLIGCDLDGTLLNKQRTVSPRTKETVQRLIARGFAFAAVTGRPLLGLPDPLTEIEGFRYCVLSNGTCVYDRIKDKIIHLRLFDPSTIDALRDVFDPLTMSVAYMSGGKLYHSKEAMAFLDEKYAYDPFFLRVFREKWKIEEDYDMIYREKRDSIEKFNLDFKALEEQERCLEGLRNVPGVEISCNSPCYTEITPTGANKRTGLLALAEHLGYTPDQVMVFGDSDNDSTLFQGDFVSFAMANAEQCILDRADYITIDHDEDGVAYALETLLLHEGTPDRIIERRRTV